jgi:hypothetical protein
MNADKLIQLVVQIILSSPNIAQDISKTLSTQTDMMCHSYVMVVDIQYKERLRVLEISRGFSQSVNENFIKSRSSLSMFSLQNVYYSTSTSIQETSSKSYYSLEIHFGYCCDTSHFLPSGTTPVKHCQRFVPIS